MTYYPDLSRYEYLEAEEEMLNVGWLDAAHGFPRGPVAPGFVDALLRLNKEPRNQTRGFHWCEFCEDVTDFSPEVRESLLKAGWAPGRAVDTSTWTVTFAESGLPAHAAAEEFLAEFGGLSFSPMDDWSMGAWFEFDPGLCVGEEDRFLEWGAELGSRLLPLGELDGGRYFLGIDEGGIVYLVETWLASFGHSRQAVENLIRRIPPEDVL